MPVLPTTLRSSRQPVPAAHTHSCLHPTLQVRRPPPFPVMPPHNTAPARVPPPMPHMLVAPSPLSHPPTAQGAQRAAPASSRRPWLTCAPAGQAPLVPVPPPHSAAPAGSGRPCRTCLTARLHCTSDPPHSRPYPATPQRSTGQFPQPMPHVLACTPALLVSTPSHPPCSPTRAQCRVPTRQFPPAMLHMLDHAPALHVRLLSSRPCPATPQRSTGQFQPPTPHASSHACLSEPASPPSHQPTAQGAAHALQLTCHVGKTPHLPCMSSHPMRAWRSGAIHATPLWAWCELGRFSQPHKTSGCATRLEQT